MKAERINKVLNEIKEQLNIDLIPTKENKSLKFFNVELPTALSEWSNYNTLLNYSNKFNTIRIEGNGYKRLAIFPLTK